MRLSDYTAVHCVCTRTLHKNICLLHRLVVCKWHASKQQIHQTPLPVQLRLYVFCVSAEQKHAADLQEAQAERAAAALP